jgi:mono/diheme cytochrome c family protein
VSQIKTMNRYPQQLCVYIALALFAGINLASAQNIENGRRLSERWCTECHAIGPEPSKRHRARPFISIATKENITAEMIASYLRLPHATMPNLPLSQQDARDIAAFIMDMKK